MHKIVRALAGAVLFGAGISGAAVVQAQQMPSGNGDPEGDGSPMRWEVTPFVGYRMGGDFDLEGATGGADLDDHGSFGLSVGLRIDETSAYELFYSRQEASFESTSPIAPFDLDVEYLHLGGTLVVSDELPLSPYIAGGLGLTRLSPQTGPGSEDTRFSVSLAGGVRLPVTRHFDVRLEARGYLTFVNSESDFFCATGSFGGVCAIRAKSDAFVQYELLAGATYSF
jgi:opacity protein-like surface antigen